MKKERKYRFQQILLGVGIMIVLVAFVMYGINVFYEEPQYNKYCEDKVYKEFKNSSECETVGGRWTPAERAPCKENYCPPPGWCDVNYTCNKEYQKEYEKYSRIVFIVATTLGVISLIGGLLIKVSSVSGGVMSGGIILLIIGVVKYWTYLSKYIQWILLGVLLALLVWIGYKKFGEK